MIDYAHITTLPSLAKIRKNPRQWDFFCWMLNQADEDGYAEVSVREYAALKKLPNSTVNGWLKSDTFRTLIEVTKYKNGTLVFFCDYASYVSVSGHNSDTIRTKVGHNSDTFRPSVRNLKEKEFSPHTPFIDKENNVGCKVATLQQQQQQAAGANFSSSALDEVATPKPQMPPRTAKQVEEARGRFWAQCCDVHSHHRDWPAEAVKSFFLFWTQWNPEQKKFKFEMEETWGTGYRMKWYIKRGHWLDEVQQAKLEQVKNGGGGRGRKSNTPTTAEIKQKEIALAIEQEEHDRRAEAAITMMANAKSHEDAKADHRYWEGLGLDNPATLAMAQEKPEWLAAYNLALQKRDEKKSQ